MPALDTGLAWEAGQNMNVAEDLGYAAFQKRHAEPCDCGHPRWAHLGILEPACGYLGGCGCARYRQLKNVA